MRTARMFYKNVSDNWGYKNIFKTIGRVSKKYKQTKERKAICVKAIAQKRG